MSSISTNVDPIEQKVVPYVAQALPVKISTADEYKRIADDAKVTAGLLREIAEHHDPIIASAYATHRLACEAKNKLERPLLARKTAQARLLGDWQAEQKRLAAEQERKKREEALRIERERQEAQAAEARRLAHEKAAEEEKARNEAEAARALSAEAFDAFDGPTADEYRQLADSEEERVLRLSLERAEADRAAAEIATAAIVAPAVRVEPDVPKVEGITGRTTWYAEFDNKRRWLAHVVENFARYESMLPWDELLKPLHGIARSVKKEIEIEPGVIARPKNSASIKA